MNLNEVKKLIEEAKSKRSKSKTEWIKPPKEANKKFVFRILPYTKEGDFTLVKWYHWGVGDMKVECTKDENCPICKVLKKYPYETIKRYLPQGVAYFNVQLPNQSDTVFLMSLSESFLNWLMTTIEETEVYDIFSPKTGRDIIIWREADRGKFEKQISLRQRAIADTDEEIENILSSTVNLDKYFKKVTDEDLIKYQEYADKLEEKLKMKLTDEDDLSIEVEEKVDVEEESKIKENKPECFGEFKGYTSEECISCDFAPDCMVIEKKNKQEI